MATCSSCGSLNPDGARYCNTCGLGLDAEVSREVRKTVTVLFADVTGSTALGEQLDPESMRRVMGRYFEVAAGCLERHGGTVEKFIGDAVMAVFGVPTAHEDDALRALRAAADLRDSLATLDEELEREYGVRLRVRTGVNTGEVVTGTQERLATGDAVNVAARLEQAARPGEILVGEPTFRLSRGAIEAEPVEPLALKGKAGLVQAYRLVRVIPGAAALQRRLDAPLVGRREELAILRSVFDRTVAERRCHLATVLGPPGIGKSRLARELATMLAGEANVLSGRCLPYGEGITYWPLVEIFRQGGAEDELTAALSAGGPEDIFWSVRKALERRARARPLALVLDDVHWAEPTLLDLVEHLALWTRDAPLLLVCLSRPELLDEHSSWDGRQILLEPLSEAESERLIDELLGGSRLPDATRVRIGEAAEGNPLFVEQLLAMVAEGGDAEHVPPTIEALVAARLDGLPAEERDLLERAAVIGLEFGWDALAELAPDRRRPAGAQLAALVRKELIRPHESIEDSFRFRHLLIRDAAYGRLSKELRADLHERFAGWLDGSGDGLDEMVGYHLEQAHHCLVDLGRSGERTRSLAERAAERLARSGRSAFARGDIEAAVNLLDRAASLLPRDDRRRLGLLPTLGRALRDAGRLEHADATLAEAVAGGLATGERAIAADARVALADLRFQAPAETGVRRADVLREIDAAVRVFDEAGDAAGLARALTLAGQLRFWGGEAALALQDLDLATGHARAAGDRAQEAVSLQYVGAAMRHGPMPVDEALARLEEISARPELNRRLEVSVLQSRAHLEAMRGRFDIARDLASRALAVAEEHGMVVLIDSHVLPATGQVELLAGDPAGAERLLRRACEGTERLGELGFLSSIATHLVEAVLDQGRDEEALALTDRWRPDRLTVPEDVDAQVGWRRGRARALARRGELEEGEHLAREAVAMAARTDYLELRAHALADLGEVLRLAGRTDESAAVLGEAMGLFEAKGNAVMAGRMRRGLGMCGGHV